MKPAHEQCDQYMAEGQYCSGYQKLQDDLAAARAGAERASFASLAYRELWKSAYKERDDLLQDLAAARALLREVLDCDQQAIPDWLANDINAALAGDKP